jgi:hypothetical protein
MKYLLFTVLLVAILITAGCVAENKNSVSATNTQTTAPMGSRYVTEVTPFLTITPTNIARQTSQPITPVPEDLTCLIYSTTQSFAHNKTAIAFNLQNPPMYFKFIVSNYPMITKTKLVTLKDGSEETIKYTEIDPASFFLITVRDKSTGEIYLQDGFGKDTGYHVGSFKLIKRGDLLIEFSGNLITADVGIWVKPIGNFNDTSKFDYKECVNWI